MNQFRNLAACILSSSWHRVHARVLSGVARRATNRDPHCLWFQHYVNRTAIYLTQSLISTLFGFADFIHPPSTCVLLVKLFYFWDVIQPEVLVRILFSSTNSFDKVAWPMVFSKERKEGREKERQKGKKEQRKGKEKENREKANHSISYFHLLTHFWRPLNDVLQ